MAAATDADWAEADAADAIDYADWAVDNAQLAMLDAIDARAYADGLAKSTATYLALAPVRLAGRTTAQEA